VYCVLPISLVLLDLCVLWFILLGIKGYHGCVKESAMYFMLTIVHLYVFLYIFLLKCTYIKFLINSNLIIVTVFILRI